ncbi:hypothetical protein [Streptomyces sp. ST2-7A]|uniref:hypothetical protein n=1 Tax=Streptomyces sp. ST2-7A TaxID=2907214 RepID=UPI001F269EC3|nr:hypothetical protein [Streptomyces sp. ST2-7A]MCE7081061.1 hypothetical protein [Streptomyces sp. ST2-7A]
MKRRIASWENGHSVPDDFYGPLLREALDLSGVQEVPLLPVSRIGYPDTIREAITGVAALWRTDLENAEGLLSSAPSVPAWHEASLRWLVAPPPTARHVRREPTFGWA